MGGAVARRAGVILKFHKFFLYEKKGTGECMNQSIKYYRVYDKLVHIY
jgi:hypothetical protein